jgi:electron transport complex protein RnfB
MAENGAGAFIGERGVYRTSLRSCVAPEAETRLGAGRPATDRPAAIQCSRIAGVTLPPPPPLADRLDDALPQTQCRRCGYDGCRPYAEAIAGGVAINRCPPGGDGLIAILSALTGQPASALDRTRGEPGPLSVARIDETLCIGCTLCLDACPVDAIVGAAKRMHTVLPALCTGCELCLPPCPVDCIAMVPAGRAWSPEDARAARGRYVARNRRRERGRTSSAPRATSLSADSERVTREAAVAAALVRARARRNTWNAGRK